MDLSGMNETDVREALVRPFLDRLGYRYGTSAHIRTEVPLRYPRAYLGRKNLAKDLPLRGRADYVLEILPDAGRWVIEVKAPREMLTLDDSEQAHTYAAHPEIAATHYLLTNGTDWQVYRVGRPDAAELAWRHGQDDALWPTIANALSEDAFRKRAKRLAIDAGKPLAAGLGSTAEIVGGFVTYREQRSPDPRRQEIRQTNGQRAIVTGGRIYRLPRGGIEAVMDMRGIVAEQDYLNGKLIGQGAVYETSAEFISRDPAAPTIFANLYRREIPRGTKLPRAGAEPIILPVDLDITAVVHASGYLDGGMLRGEFEIAFKFTPKAPVQQVSAFGEEDSFAAFDVISAGDFEIRVV